jgi:hypothetical protein
MHLLQKYLLSNVFRSPDDPVAPADGETPPVDPAVAGALDPEVPPEPVDGEPPEPEVKPAHGNKGKSPWFLDRIAEETGKRQATERELADTRALLASLQAAQPPDPAKPAPRAAPEPANDVLGQAEKIVLYRDTADVRNAGDRAFQDFDASLRVVSSVVGNTFDDFCADLIAVDKANAHVILDKLAKDPEQAVRLAGMDTRRRTAELTRMSMTAQAPAVDPKPAEPKPVPVVPAKPAAKSVSRAPNPPPPVDSSASKTVDWRQDEASDAEFDRGFNEMMEKRAKAGRR